MIYPFDLCAFFILLSPVYIRGAATGNNLWESHYGGQLEDQYIEVLSLLWATRPKEVNNSPIEEYDRATRQTVSQSNS
jgi:hypothetical protein